MLDVNLHKTQIEAKGFTIIDHLFSGDQVEKILQLIDQTDTSGKTFRKSADLFAIRQFLKEVPEVSNLILNDEFRLLINALFGADYFIVKAIYFDKPALSNWFVSYHRDLTISVDRKVALENYSKWTVKPDQFSVQPPLKILEQNYTIRIHLDDTDEYNGALKVVPGSHLKGIYKAEDIDWANETEHVCSVPRGGVMIMKPLLLHSSSRTTNNHKRRVIHLEFSNQELHEALKWAERISLPE